MVHTRPWATSPMPCRAGLVLNAYVPGIVKAEITPITIVSPHGGIRSRDNTGKLHWATFSASFLHRSHGAWAS